MSKEVKINYNNTFATQHSRDYYRGASFHWSGEWMVGAHYLSDDYNIDYVVHGQVLLACAKSHLSTLENEPKDFIRDESGTVIGVVSTYWDFVLSGIVGKSPGIKIQDNYWYICKDTGVPEEEQVWENTGVKAKMELSDLTPEEIEILQRPGKEVVTEFVNNTMTQSAGQDPTKIMSQKATTDALNTKASNSALSAAIENEVLRANNAYQQKGDYATNTRVDGLQEELNTFKGETADNFDSVGDSLETLQNNIDNVVESIPTKVSELENDSNYQTKTNVETLLEPINAVIPQAATSLNQLADKAFVNSSIATSTANFRGTSAAGLTEAQFLTWANGLTHDENDYIYWNTVDSVGNVVFKRYKYSGNSWIYEYDLNNSSFTADEWAAIQSGINSTLVTKLSDLPTNADLTTALNSKVDKVAGKQLSTEDYTTAEKNKLAGIEANAQVNKLEGIKVDGTELPIIDKKVNVDLSGKVNVALHQLQEDQSFVFRQTGGNNLTVDAKNAELVSIKGRTLVWNQMMQVVYPNPTLWSGYTISIEDGYTIFTWENQRNISRLFLYSAPNEGWSPTTGHKYYISVYVRRLRGISLASNSVQLSFFGEASYLCKGSEFVEGARFSQIKDSFGSSPNMSLYQASGDGTIESGGKLSFWVNTIDLTKMFGEGNEPSAVEEFEAMFPNAYYPYNAGTLISNDASTLETVGFNQWNGILERGYWNANTGEPGSGANWKRSKNPIKVFPNTDYYWKVAQTGASIGYFVYYDAEMNYIGSSVGDTGQGNNVHTTPANCRFIHFYVGASYVESDICINLSSDKNGTYEPYWKRMLNLELDSFKVKDTQDNVITITGGLKSAGFIYDEIKDGKYIKRIETRAYQSGDESNSAVTTDGTNTNYAIATPVKYELVEQILTDYKVDKLGTERVISDTVPTPPFRTDIEYHEANIKDVEIEGITEYLKRKELTDELDKLDSIEESAQVNKIEHIQINGTEQTITNKTVNLPAYPTTLPASDVSAWAKAATKPSYNFSEIGGSVANSQLPSSISIENITASGQLSGNAFKVIAEHIAKLTSRIEALENGIGVTDTLTSNSVDSANGYYINGDKTVIIGSGAPTVVPAFAGQFYINTSGPALYYAVNNSATTDWKQA